MRVFSARSRTADFAVLGGTSRSQAAMMVLAPGAATGERDDSEHPACDQWLYVLAGRGEAIGPKRRLRLSRGSLLLIPAGQGHRIRNTGATPLRTLNLYAPAAYDARGNPLPRRRGKSLTKE